MENHLTQLEQPEDSQPDVLVSLQDVTIQVGNKILFEHASWTIKKNAHWAICGETGSGKSILAKAICHKVPLINGRILYFLDRNDRSQGHPFPKPNEVLIYSSETHQDFLTQFAGYHQARWQSFEGEDVPTVSDILTGKSIEHHSPYETTPLAIDEQVYRQRRDFAVRLFGLDYLLERKVHSLSHGESRKVFLTRLLMISPGLLILDDPYNGIDQASRVPLSQAIESLIQRANPQILFISSRIEDIPISVGHILMVKDGRIEAEGNRETILAASHLLPPLTPYATKTPSFHKSPEFEAAIRNYSLATESDDRFDIPAFVEMQNISVKYGNVEVLKDISWSVKKGERWAISGHNGAGKTTLLSLILADNPQAYANKLSLFGKKRGSGESIWEIKSAIGWVSPELLIYYPQSISSLEAVSSGYFDSVGLYHTCTPAQVDAAARWMDALGIIHLADLLFSSLSTGQRRLVLLARALVKNPPLLILDEPCQGLDDFHRRYFIELVNQLCLNSPVTLIYVTHYQDELPQAITHQLKLDHGRVVQNGPLGQ